MDSLAEESRRLEPQICETSSRYSREKRLESVRLSTVYYITWVLLIVLALVAPFYEWLFIDGPECWSDRYPLIMISVLVAMLTTAVSTLLFIINCVNRVSISYWRLNFCSLCFLVLTIISIINFLLAIFYFSLQSCYFLQISPASRIESNSNWFTIFAFKYDIKVVGVLHILCCLFAFTTGIGFAIIKNNFKYIRQVDLE